MNIVQIKLSESNGTVNCVSASTVDSESGALIGNSKNLAKLVAETLDEYKSQAVYFESTQVSDNGSIETVYNWTWNLGYLPAEVLLSLAKQI